MPELLDEIVKMAKPGQGWTAPGNRRQEDPPLASQQKWAKEHPVYIFNVGPWKQRILRGSFSRDIPGCAEGALYSEPVIIPGIVTEPYPKDERSMSTLQYDGKLFALDLIGIGIGIPHHEKLTRFGVFVSETNPPSEEDLAKANSLLDLECNNLVNDMTVASSEGPKVARETYQPKYHDAAAKRLHKTRAECPWLGQAAVQSSNSIECPFCGTYMDADKPRCPSLKCGEIVNQVAYDAALEKAGRGKKKTAA